MPLDSLRSIALDLGLPERTVRRAASEGLIRGERVGSRGWRTSVRERDYLRRHWSFLMALREAFRTEPNVRLAVLYGSHALGTESPSSDIDLVVDLRDDDISRLVELSGRLARSFDGDFQPVRIADAKREPALLADVLRQGRVIVDRDNQWWDLKARQGRREAPQSPDSELDSAISELDFGDSQP